MSTALTAYTTSTNDTLLTTARQLTAASGTSLGNMVNSTIGTSTGYGELTSQGTSAVWAAATSLPAPTGNGFLLDDTSLEGQQILAGTWTPTTWHKVSAGSIVADIYVRAYVRHSDGTYTQIGSNMVMTGQTITTTATSFAQAGTSQPVQNFGVGDKLYIDVWLHVTTNSTGSSSATVGIRERSTGTGTSSATQLATPGYQPTPQLAVSLPTLSFSGNVGGASPASQNDTLSETAGTATAWTSSISYTSGTGWLSISPISGSLAASGNQVIAVSCALGALAAGTYTATITFTATTGGSTAAISVTFTVNAAPPPAQPGTSPSILSFTALAGGANPATQNDTLTNTGGVSSTWTSSISYTTGSGWLAISPTSGTLSAGANATIVFTCTTGSLTVGTYSATVTFSMGSSQATVTVSFRITTPPITSYTIKLAGQDITAYVDQMSIDITDTLGQGAGAGSSSSTQGRASTVKLNTSLGPVGTAVGAGQAIPGGGPWLVRQGEVQVYDATGTIIFGGFVTKLTDTSTSILGQTKKNFTAVEGVDYSTSLQRTLVNEVFTGATDISIIQYIMNKYVGWVNLQYLPANPGYTFATKNFRNVSVEQVIQTVAGITGYLVFVDYLKNLHYVSPTTASSAPFNLSSAPDFVTTFPHAVEEYLVDDNSAINRVFFYGGTKTSNDFWQDISPLANGNNVTFPLAYYPSPMTDGKYHLQINGVDQTIATSTSAGAVGQFVSQGGTATVLIDPGAKAITFDAGYAPAAGTTILAGYRYAFPLSLIITDEASHRYYGSSYLDGSIDDNTIFDITTAIQRCKVLLSQQSYGLVTLKLDVYKPGIQAGMVIHVYNQLRGINGTYLVQETQISPYGAGNFVYHLTLGAWNWNLIDFLMKLPTLATFQDNQSETQETVNIVQVLTNVNVHDAWSTRTSQQGVYYARAAAVGDGHDAYPGFSTVTS